VNEAVSIRCMGRHYFFSFELFSLERTPEARLGGLTRLVVRFSQKLLAVPAFAVQNGRAKS
jgi:hypothetical protein